MRDHIRGNNSVVGVLGPGVEFEDVATVATAA